MSSWVTEVWSNMGGERAKVRKAGMGRAANGQDDTRYRENTMAAGRAVQNRLHAPAIISGCSWVRIQHIQGGYGARIGTSQGIKHGKKDG
jgi:hypothetical protein